MCVCKSIIVFINLFLFINLVQCAEFVPVYMWSTSKANEKVPALHKISQDSFKDDILERLKDDPFVIVFSEETLSPEDFAQHDQSGKIVFPNLSKLRKAAKVSYLPYVQNPINALKHLDEDVTELSVANFRKDLVIPEGHFLFIDLNDASDDEDRAQLLKRHDAAIISIYEEILKKYDNVLALYTAHHTSWIAPEDVPHSRNARALPSVSLRNFVAGSSSFVYLTNSTFVANKSVNANLTEVTLTFTDSRSTDNTEIILTGTSPELTVELTFKADTSPGYWELTKTVARHNSVEYNLTSSSSTIVAPKGFSYHCGDQVFTNADKNFEVYLTYFQVQPFFNGLNNVTKFSDAYDCVGFTSVPIWSGIFVTSILLLIMTFGITMMMDIRTMDRFDDAKGKTITINAE